MQTSRQSHAQISRSLETKEEKREIIPVPVLLDYAEYRRHIDSIKASFKHFKQISQEDKRIPADTSEKVLNGFFTNLKACEKQYPEFAKQYLKEKYKPLADIAKKRKDNIFELSAAIICCLPSHLLTFCHSFFGLCNNNNAGIEIGDFWSIGCTEDDLRPFSKRYPQLDFICKPITLIKEKTKEIKQQNAEIAALSNLLVEDEDLKPGPTPQRML